MAVYALVELAITMEAAKGWYDSEEYQAILPHRTANSRCKFIWLEGYSA